MSVVLDFGSWCTTMFQFQPTLITHDRQLHFTTQQPQHGFDSKHNIPSQEPAEENTYLQTREEAAGVLPLVALGTSANLVELVFPQQSHQTCSACLLQSGQDQNVSEALMPLESSHSPRSQLPQTQCLKGEVVETPCSRSLDLSLFREPLQYIISQKISSSPMRSTRVAENILPSACSDGEEANVSGQSQSCCKVCAGKALLAESDLVAASMLSSGSNLHGKSGSDNMGGSSVCVFVSSFLTKEKKK